MPIRKSDYPLDWEAISLQVRTDAGWKCEWCGAPGDKVIRRGKGAEWEEIYAVRAPDASEWESVVGMSWARLKFHGLTRIVLTTAHLDRDSTNNERVNLASLCQSCHLNHDRAAQHVPNRKYGRHYSKLPQLKLDL